MFEPLAGELDHPRDRRRLLVLAAGMPGLIVGEPRSGDADVTAQGRQGPAELFAKGDELLWRHAAAYAHPCSDCKLSSASGAYFGAPESPISRPRRGTGRGWRSP